MRSFALLLEKLYWLVVILVPLFPWYMLDALQTRLACAYGTPCFEFGITYYSQGAAAGILTGIVLWPMCVWQLFGKHIWRQARKRRAGA